ncbi:hypothetical protein [Leptospira johnsonii]|uniref:Uncharacterized protein n=1 Tax=Leptospira johnsonii TaxID=1917820 RepID=A0A2P2D7S4_9LEPT|nr:hypothetical protein [Leptospira johnsonii]GBF40674.1 hypothetical protein LPTSP1_36920 [Leptospira johnsonii]
MSPFPLTKAASEWCKENIGDNEMYYVADEFNIIKDGIESLEEAVSLAQSTIADVFDESGDCVWQNEELILK